MGEKLHVFDVLEVGGQNQRDKPAFERYMMAWGLDPLLRENERKNSMTFSQASWEPTAKAMMLKSFEEAGLKGVVFKRKEAPCTGNEAGAESVHFAFALNAQHDLQDKRKRPGPSPFERDGPFVRIASAAPNGAVVVPGVRISQTAKQAT